MEKLLVVDGSSILFRAFFALPPMNTKDGKNTNALLGFFNIVLKAIDTIKPSDLAICFDLKGGSFRTKMYSGYKSNRQKAPDELSEQFIYLKDILDGFGLSYFELEGFEADDLAGTIAKKASESCEVYFLSGDKDYLQLISENTILMYTKTGNSDFELYDLETLKDKMGITPIQMRDLKGLMGDKSDNIPGIDGIGEKTALKLLDEFGTIENLYSNIDKLKKNKTNEKVIAGEEIARLSKELATIDTDVALDLDDINTHLESYNKIGAKEALEKYELNSIIKRLNLESESALTKSEESIEFNININLEIDKIILDIFKNKNFAFKFLATDKPYKNGELFKFAIATGDNIYINDAISSDILKFKDVLESEEIEKYGYSVKEDILLFIHNDIDLKNLVSDIKLGEYLIDPTESDYSIKKLSEKYGIYFENHPDEKLFKKDFINWDKEDLNNYLIIEMSTILQIKNIQDKNIEEEEETSLYHDIEIPLTKVLADMEYTGVYTDREELLSIGKDLESEMLVIQDRIYELAGEEFNINSPKQLGVILFDKLNLPVIKKTKTGYSTNAEVLEKLESEHEIISYITRYRMLSKLISTYVEGMVGYINEDNRIHSNFQQTVTATGRLSSTDPNLQNIPIRTAEGREFRKIFKAKNSNYKLIGADYSQIELRLLAAISKDKNMLDAFKNGIDIHTTTASQVFSVELDEVDLEMRSRAKAVNFGIVYGISDYGLSRDLNIPRATSKKYIDAYFENFYGVKKYMDDIIEEGKSKGYVKTLLNRRRYLPELNSKNFNIRNFGERIALNTPIQGTAADIIKIAMVNIYNELKKRNLKSKLILQIHDELILEVPNEELEEVSELVKEKMENAYNLIVDLVVDLNCGESWYDTK